MADIELEAIAESIGMKKLMEGNPREKFLRKLIDRTNVHQFVIITSMNPHFPDAVAGGEDTDQPLEALKEYLRRGHFGWIPIRGQYGESERSFMIPNLTKEEGEDIARRFGQESFIFGHKTDTGFTYEFWKTKDGQSYYLMDAKDMYNRDDSSEDFYSTHKSGVKFSMPFKFDEAVVRAIGEYDNYISEKCSKHMGFEERQKLILEAIDPKQHGKHRWIARAEINETDTHFFRMKEEMAKRGN